MEEELKLTGRIERGEVIIDEKNMPTWKDGYQGMGIKPEMVKEYKEQWGKINKLVE